MPAGRIAVFGGTFDPPHIGHLVLAECALVQFGCERVLFVPAGDPYRKSGTDTPENRAAAAPVVRTITPARQRVAMAKLAIAGNEAFAVDSRETERRGPSYTVETLRELHAEGHEDLLFVLGSDALADLPNWREPAEIARLATIVVAEKEPGAGTGGYEAVRMPMLRISSTEIRGRVKRGEPIRYLVPDAVEKYIREHKLYLA